jgi:hypothetical protein
MGYLLHEIMLAAPLMMAACCARCAVGKVARKRPTSNRSNLADDHGLLASEIMSL